MSKIYKTDGIVIKSMKYGESSLILDIYTYQKGLRSFIVSGIRGKHSKAAVYQMMNQLSLVAYDSGPEKLNRIKEAKVCRIYNGLGRDMVKSSIGIFIMDLFRQSVKEQEPNEEQYLFLKNSLDHIDKAQGNLAIFPIIFSLAFCDQLGFYPQNNYSEYSPRFSLFDGAFVSDLDTSQYVLTTELSEALHKILLHLSNGDPLIIPNRDERNELLNQIINFYKLQLDSFGELRSLEIIQALFE